MKWEQEGDRSNDGGDCIQSPCETLIEKREKVIRYLRPLTGAEAEEKYPAENGTGIGVKESGERGEELEEGRPNQERLKLKKKVKKKGMMGRKRKGEGRMKRERKRKWEGLKL